MISQSGLFRSLNCLIFNTETGPGAPRKRCSAAVVQLIDGSGWRWEVKLANGKTDPVTPISRASAIGIAEYEIDRVLLKTEIRGLSWRPLLCAPYHRIWCTAQDR